MGINILQFSLGTILLYFGADYLILGSKSIASKFKIPPIVVGITLVAFGTSLPELIVSIIAILKGEPGIVIGNVVGSNIANIGLVLGVTTILKPIIFSFKIGPAKAFVSTGCRVTIKAAIPVGKPIEIE